MAIEAALGRRIHVRSDPFRGIKDAAGFLRTAIAQRLPKRHSPNVLAEEINLFYESENPSQGHFTMIKVHGKSFSIIDPAPQATSTVESKAVSASPLSENSHGYIAVDGYSPTDPNQRMWEGFAKDNGHHLSPLANAIRTPAEEQTTVIWRAPVADVAEKTGTSEEHIRHKAEILNGVLAIDEQSDEIYLVPASPSKPIAA